MLTSNTLMDAATEFEQPYPALDDNKGLKAFYNQYGFVVLRGLLDKRLCQQAKDCFLNQVKTFNGPMLRQTTNRREAHNISEHGLMTNPLLNVHMIEEPRFAAYVTAVTQILTDPNMQEKLRFIMADDPVLVQSMYFESSRGTDPHQDSHFLDSKPFGSLIGAWIALENIHNDAGRFCVFPTSHRLEEPGLFDEAISRQALDYGQDAIEVIYGYQVEKKNFAINRITKSRRKLTKLVREAGLKALAPALEQGDVVLFSALTIHSSRKPAMVPQSRNSLTCHFVPREAGLVRYQKVNEPLQLQTLNKVMVHKLPASQTQGR